MSIQGWLVFAGFWAVFVTTPGPNAVNCIANGMRFGFLRALWGVAGILTQATLFLTLSAAGVTALIAASPVLFGWVKFAGALVLIGLGIRGWLTATAPVRPNEHGAHGIYAKAFVIATVNAKSIAGYLAAFSQFVEPGVPVVQQMGLIYPAALTLTFASYAGYTGLGVALGRSAMAAVLNVWVRRTLAACFVLYGIALMLAATPGAGAPG